MSGRNLPAPTRMLLLLFSLICAPLIHAQSTFQPTDGGIFLGSFRTRAHRVAGDVYLLTERIMEIRGYSYDGTAPVVYFWVCSLKERSAYALITIQPEIYSQHLSFSTSRSHVGRHKSSTHSWWDHPLGRFAFTELRHTRWRSRSSPCREPTCAARGVSRRPVHP